MKEHGEYNTADGASDEAHHESQGHAEYSITAPSGIGGS